MKTPSRQQDEGRPWCHLHFASPSAFHEMRDQAGLISALTGNPGSLRPVVFRIYRSNWTIVRSSGVDFTLVPAASHLPAALWEACRLLVSALVVLK
jgi:hypothetical protein